MRPETLRFAQGDTTLPILVVKFINAIVGISQACEGVSN